MLSLYEISAEIEALLATVDTETGEISDEVYAALESLEMDREEKAVNLACYIKALKAEVVAIKAEEKKLKARRDAIENKEIRLSDYLAGHVGRGNKISDPRATISWRKSTRLEVDPDALPPLEYTKVEAPKWDKAAAKKALADPRVVIEGAELIERLNLAIK